MGLLLGFVWEGVWIERRGDSLTDLMSKELEAIRNGLIKTDV